LKVIRFQKKNGVPVPYSEEDELAWSGFAENQITTHKVTGVKKPRSYQQLKMFHALLKKVADNSVDPNFNTPEKVKFSIKVQLHFVDDSVTVVDKDGNVHFKYRSFGYESLPHMEACNVFDRAMVIMADVLGCTVDELLESLGD
jgi:hypothetical protein